MSGAEAGRTVGELIGGLLIPLAVIAMAAGLGIKGLNGNIPWSRKKNITGIPARVIGIVCIALAIIFAVAVISNLARQ